MLRAGPALLVLAVSIAATPVRAEQFVLTDVSYTHAADTTQDSHYYPELPPDTPKDWTKPVDYAHGSVHVVVDVKSKPAGDAPTKIQLCFEGTPSYGCSAQSPTYTKTGRVEWDSPFSGFWYESTVDWAQGIKRMPVILKDDKNNKPAGDPKYVPTELHVQVTLVSAGSKFAAPSPAAGSGGSAGGGGKPAGGTGGSRAVTGGAGGRVESGGAGKPSGGAGAPAVVARAGAGGVAAGGAGGTKAAVGGGGGGAVAATPQPMAAGGKSVITQDSAGCRAAGSGTSSPWGALLALGWLAWRRRGRGSRRIERL